MYRSPIVATGSLPSWNQCGYENCNQAARNLRRYLRPEDLDQQREHTDTERHPVNRVKCFRIGSAFINKFGWHSSHGQTEEVLELSGEDADGNTKCKADRDRLRDKFDQIAEMAQSHDDHDDTGQKK